jgi:hypothetical protein
MAVASDISPNTDNLVMSTGYWKFWGPDDSGYRDLGEALAGTFHLTATELIHQTKRGGTRREDFSSSQSLAAEVTLMLQEMTSDNFVIALLSSPKDVGPPIRLSIGARPEIAGKLRWISDNNTGPRSQFDFDSVKFSPSSALDLLKDGWSDMSLTAKVFWNPTGGVEGTGAFGIMYHNITDEVT